MNDSEPGFEADDETRRLLTAADPARSLPPADADALASLLEDTMSQPTDQTPVSAGSGRRGPSRLLLVGGIAAASVVAAVAVVVATHGSDDTTRTPSAAKTASATVTKLQVGGAGAGKCMAPTAGLVATQPLAFEGTVTSVKDGVATLDAHHFYAGAPTDVVTVTESDPGSSESVNFRAGDDYIVAAKDGQVSMCLSGLASDDLRAAYAQAFGQ